jgi:Xaa-Pro dipeptidase
LITWPRYGRVSAKSNKTSTELGVRPIETDRLAQTLRNAGVAMALLSSGEDVCYATGFEVPPPIDAGAAFARGPALALVDAAGSRILLAPGAYAFHAGELSRADETVLVPGFGHFDQVDAREELLSAVRAALRSLSLSGAQVIAVDEATLPSEIHSLLSRELPEARFVDVLPLVRSARLIKSAHEVELLRRAAAAADAGQRALLDVAVPGRNELEVMGDVLTQVDSAAGRPLLWTGELVSGARTGILRYPGGPIDRELVDGDTVLMDLSVRYLGYWADCTNTLVLGEPTKDQLRYFRAAVDAYEAAVGELRPGKLASEVHASATKAFRRHGFEPTHYTGHQVGVTVNEEPRLVPYDHTPIEAGMVFAVEPGCYGGIDVGTGARAERVVLVSDDGVEPLTGFPWGIEAS